MNFNHIVSLLESDFVVDKVLQELNLIQKLPETGLLAGQGVASILTEVLGGFNINTVVNDIDIFYLFKNDFKMQEQTASFFGKKRKMMANNLMEVFEVDSSTNGYHGRKVLTTGLYKYSIVGTTRFQKINKVFLSNISSFGSSITRETFISNVISSFDINSTQVGIDIQTKKLFYTRSFVKFLISKQLEIVNWNTPAHSLIRLMKKQKELGVYCNEEETKMLASVIFSGYKQISDKINLFDSIILESTEKHIYVENINVKNWNALMESSLNRIPLFFGEKYKKDLLNYGFSIFDDFDVVERVKPGEATSEYQYESFLAKDTNDYNLYSLLSKNSGANINKFIRELENSNFIRYSNECKEKYGRYYLQEIEASFSNILYSDSQRNKYFSDSFSLVFALPKIFNSYKNVRKNVVYFFNDYCRFDFLQERDFSEKEINDFKKIALPLVHDVLFPKVFINVEQLNNIDMYVLKSLFAKSSKHSELANLISNSTVEELYAMAKELELLENEFGEMIYPVIERNVYYPRDITFENVAPFVRNLIAQKNVPLKERLVDSKNDFGEIKELISGLELYNEGKEMGHCVGGYTLQVKAGNSLIFASKTTEGERGTLEIRPFEDKEKGTLYKVNQYYGRFNRRLVYEDVEPFLKEVDKVYKILPLSDKERKYIFGDDIQECVLNLDENLIPF